MIPLTFRKPRHYWRSWGAETVEVHQLTAADGPCCSCLGAAGEVWAVNDQPTSYMLYAATGQRAQARAALSAAIEMDRARDMTFWLPQAEAVLAQVAQP